MGGLAPWHLILFLVALSTIIPIVKVVGRTGLNPWWGLAFFIPLVGWIFLWAFAFARWPKVDSEPKL